MRTTIFLVVVHVVNALTVTVFGRLIYLYGISNSHT